MRTLPRALLAVLLAALPLAGCVAPGAADEPELQPAPEPVASSGEPSTEAPTTGSLVVAARMPDGAALAGVALTLGNRSAQTGTTGEARFDAVGPGAYVLEARKEAHRTAQMNVTLRAGEETRVEIVLQAAGEDNHAHEGGVYAHRDLYKFAGHFDCSLTYVIITGDCLLLVDNLTATAGAGAPAGDATGERHLIDFPLDLSWTSLVVEMVWEPPATSVADGMTLALEPSEAPADGHAAKYARVTGGSPLRIDLSPGLKHETATAEDMPNPLGGEVIRARAYVKGLAHNPGGTDFLGVGASAQHDFQLYVSIFYGAPAPEGYTAVEVA